MSFPKPYADAVAKLRVPGGFILVAAFLWLSAPSPFSLAIGMPVSILGLALRAWAAGHLEKNTTLADEGAVCLRSQSFIYRDADYGRGTGDRIAPVGVGRAVRVVFLLIYLPVVELEEQHLRSLFPEYDSYARRVPKLLPRFSGRSVRNAFDGLFTGRTRSFKRSLVSSRVPSFLFGKPSGSASTQRATTGSDQRRRCGLRCG